MLARLADEYGFTIQAIEYESPAGQAFARWGGIKFPPGIFIDMQPVCYGRPSEGRLRRELDQRRTPTAP